jgi:hypothetical protein
MGCPKVLSKGDQRREEEGGKSMLDEIINQNEAINQKTPLPDHGERKNPSCRNVHVATDSLICLLPSCKKPFQPRAREKGGKTQQFCCPDHRRMFFSLARKVGAILLQENGHDPNLKMIVDRILGTSGKIT